MMFVFTTAQAQKHSQYTNVPLETPQDYSRAEKNVLQAANYILSTPLNKQSNSRSEAMHFLVDWMQGTPAFMFPLNEPIGKISSENPELLIIYMACMTRFVLESDSSKAPDQNEIAYNAYMIFSDYCAEPGNHVTIYGELKNLIDAKKAGNLRDYLDEFSDQPKGKMV